MTQLKIYSCNDLYLCDYMYLIDSNDNKSIYR